jgi:hypothetical protein
MFFNLLPDGHTMRFGRSYLLLAAILLFAVLIAGCASTKTTPGPSAPIQAPTGTPAGNAAPVAATTTPACPDNLVWEGNWDTRWVVESHDITEDAKVWIETGKDDPTGLGPYPVTLTQKCWDVTGTYTPGIGTITAKIDGNKLKGTYNWVGTTPADTDHGTFTVTMAADNQSWVGYARSYTRGEYADPNNWYGKKSS